MKLAGWTQHEDYIASDGISEYRFTLMQLPEAVPLYQPLIEAVEVPCNNVSTAFNYDDCILSAWDSRQQRERSLHLDSLTRTECQKRFQAKKR